MKISKNIALIIAIIISAIGCAMFIVGVLGLRGYDYCPAGAVENTKYNPVLCILNGSIVETLHETPNYSGYLALAIMGPLVMCWFILFYILAVIFYGIAWCGWCIDNSCCRQNTKSNNPPIMEV
jgi:hypothetical protein